MGLYDVNTPQSVREGTPLDYLTREQDIKQVML